MFKDIKWAQVPEFVNYEVSSAGQVRSIERKIIINGKERMVKQRELKPSISKGGYAKVRLYKEGNNCYKYVHRLVAVAFLKKEEGRDFVNHKDGNPRNNNADNLGWVSHAENVTHAYEIGLNRNRGEYNKSAIAVIDNRSGRKFETIKEFCEHYGINYNTGRNFLNGYSKCPKTIDLSEYSFKKMSHEKVIGAE